MMGLPDDSCGGCGELSICFPLLVLIRNSVVAKIATTAADGNKRIAAALFICFLDRNGILYRKDRSQRIDNNALVALTLMIAVSKPREKEMMIKIILNMLV